MVDKNFAFYAEIIIVSIVSLIAASAWKECMKNCFYHYYPQCRTSELIFAIIITFIALFILYIVFKTLGDKDEKKTSNKEDYEPEKVYHFQHSYALPMWSVYFFLTIKKKMKKLFFLKIFYGDGYP